MTVRRPEPAAIDYKGRRFLITDRPTDVNMTRYIQVRRRHKASVFFVCLGQEAQLPHRDCVTLSVSKFVLCFTRYGI